MCLAIPALVIERLPDQMARISRDGVIKTVSVALIDDVAPGDYVTVHVDHALAKLDSAEAELTLALFAEAGRLMAREAAAGS